MNQIKFLKPTIMKFHQAITDKIYNRRESMIDQNIQVWWANGQEWAVKWENGHYFYRPEDADGAWKKGTPPGACEADMDTDPPI